MALKRLGFVAAQLAPKPGARDALTRVVTTADLPGTDWTVADERTWRTGISGPATEWGKRARSAGSVTAWRSFNSADRRWCWVQVVPFASAPDALSAIGEVWHRGLRNVRSEVTVLHEQDVTLEPFLGANRMSAHEHYTYGSSGNEVTRMLAAATGPFVIVLSASGTPEWTWDSVIALAQRQAALVAGDRSDE